MRQQKLLHALGRLHADRSGNFAILFGVSAMVLMLSGGIAVDFTRAMSAKSAMANALDAAVLSTARRISTGEIKMEEAQVELHSFFVANMQVPEESFDRYQIENVQFNTEEETLTATASHAYETLFRFFGENNAHTIRTSAGATYGTSGTAEIAMTFDITGSMNNGKLEALQAAAITGVTKLLEKNQPGKENTRISSIPYAAAVNAGGLSRYVWPDQGAASIDSITLTQREEAMESTGDDGTADGPGGGGPGGGGAQGGDPHASASPDDCSTERKGDFMYSSVGPDVALVNRDARLGMDEEGDFNARACPSAAIMPLTPGADALIAAIESFEHDGSTAGHIGIQWAWYTLSPHWADFLPGEAAPLDPQDPDVNVRKYAIIMTDGEFNTAYAGVEEAVADQNGADASAAHTRALCTAMKAEGIEIFTIGFGLSSNTTSENAKALLKECASPDRDDVTFFYDASTGAELTTAYTNIAGAIQAIRLVQ